MPLIKSASRAAVSQNIREMKASGYPQKQAIAAALSNARRYGKKFAEGGDVDDSFSDRPLPKPGQSVPQPNPLQENRDQRMAASRAVADAMMPYWAKGPSDQEIAQRGSDLQLGRNKPGKIPSTEPMNPMPFAAVDTLGALPVGGAAKLATFLGPFGATMMRNTLKMHPAVRANLPEKLASALSGSHPEFREAAASAIQANRDIAARNILEMRRLGGNPEDKDLFKYAGWHRGEEGAAKREISDIGAKLELDGMMDIPGEGRRMGYRLVHPAGDLHATYDIPPIVFDRRIPSGNAKADVQTGQITVGGDPWNKSHMKQAVASALHEVQHVIQKKEGFAPGSNLLSEHFNPEMYAQEKGVDQPQNVNPTAVYVKNMLGVDDPAAFKAYHRSAGETEARNVEARRAKSFRYLAHPRDTEDVPSGLQIVRDKVGAGPMGSIEFGQPAGWRNKMERRDGGTVTPWQSGNKFANGGTPWVERTSAHGLTHSGMIRSPVPGRTDKLPISVGGGAYILPADHLSALGQGNSDAGANIVNRMFKMGPQAGNPLGRMPTGIKQLRSPASKISVRVGKPHFADGGDAPPVPIIAAGGEYAIPPDKVAEIGGGDMDRGHKILDHWVLATRKEHIKTLRGLKPPKQ